MNRDDHLFAIIGGTVVTAAATVFLVFAGGITGTIDHRPVVRVTPNTMVESPEAPSDIVPAGYEAPAPSLGDDLVRLLASRISAHSEWSSWLVTDGLVKRFVTAVEAVADGYSPRSELGFVKTGHPFLVREDEGRFVIAAGTYRRFDLAVEVFSSLDAGGVVAVFHELEASIEDARRGVAWHRGDFEDRLRQAIDHLLEVDVPDGPIEVERRTTTYAFADDEYERLSDAQRQLLRMGRGNAIAVQNKLRDIRTAFGWPASPSPAAVRHALIGGGDAAISDPVLIAEGPALEREPGEIFIGPSAEPAMTLLDPPASEVVTSILVAVEEKAVPAE